MIFHVASGYAFLNGTDLTDTAASPAPDPPIPRYRLTLKAPALPRSTDEKQNKYLFLQDVARWLHQLPQWEILRDNLHDPKMIAILGKFPGPEHRSESFIRSTHVGRGWRYGRLGLGQPH